MKQMSPKKSVCLKYQYDECLRNLNILELGGGDTHLALSLPFCSSTSFMLVFQEVTYYCLESVKQQTDHGEVFGKQILSANLQVAY